MLHIFQDEPRETKSTTSSVRVKSVVNMVDEIPEGVEIPKKKETDSHREILLSSGQKHSPLTPDKSSLTKKMECSEKLQNTEEHIPSESSSQSESHRQIHQCITSDPIAQQIALSRSSSVSSTGTYNVESPKETKTYDNANTDTPRNLRNTKTKIIDSVGSEDSSTGTYNVESPKMSKISSKSNTDVSKMFKNKNPKRADSQSSSISHFSRRSSKQEASSSASHKKSIPSMSSFHIREEVSSEVPEEQPSNSQAATALPLQIPTQMVILFKFLSFC